MKLSIVVIAQNEVLHLEKVLKSLLDLSHLDYEVIGIDCNSIDGTGLVFKEYSKKFKSFRGFSIQGEANAASARNLGALAAKGENILFLDGDIEINSDFIDQSLKRDLDKELITGELLENFYSPESSMLLKGQVKRYGYDSIQEVKSCGGNFILGHSLFKKIGSFDETLKVNEDFDYVLRADSFSKIFALGCLGTHHTVHYGEKQRILYGLRSRYLSFSAKLFRKYFFHLRALVTLIKGPFRGIFLGGCLWFMTLSLWFGRGEGVAFTFLLLFAFIDLGIGVFKKQFLLHRAVEHYLYPLLLVYYFFCPRRTVYHYEVLPILSD